MSEYIGIFDQEFLTRTKNILEEYNGPYEFTLLLNCTLSLICLPVEVLKKDNFGKPNLEIVTQIADELRSILHKEEKNDLALLKCLRNGIAHLKIIFINSNNKLERVIINGGTTIDDNNYNLIFKFKQKQLKDFALSITNLFLEYSKNNLK